MNLKQLEYFVDLAQTLSYTKTAQRLYVSQTAVTKQIKNLESELGIVLFDRDKRHVSLTAEELSDIVYDARKEQDSRSSSELEGAMLKVSCSLGEAIVNEFIVNPDMRPYVSVIPLQPRQTRDIFMMCHEDEHNALIANFKTSLFLSDL